MKNPKAEASLARFQEALLKALFENENALEIKEQTLGDCPPPKWRDYLQGADPEMLELAALIFQKWGCQGGEECSHPSW